MPSSLELPRPRRLKVSDQIAAILRREILADRFQPGDRLPAERVLAERLGTNRNTLREAIRLLQAGGLVRAEQGNGVVVQDFRRTGELPLIPHFLVEGADAAERVQALRDLLPMRRFFAAQAAALAAERASTERLDELRQLVAEQKQALVGDSQANVLENDVAIYRALVEASGSLVGRMVFNTIAAIYRAILSLFPRLWFVPEGYDAYLDGLVERVASGRGLEARRFVEAHLETVDAVLDPLLAQVGPELFQDASPSEQR